MGVSTCSHELPHLNVSSAATMMLGIPFLTVQDGDTNVHTTMMRTTNNGTRTECTWFKKEWTVDNYLVVKGGDINQFRF